MLEKLFKLKEHKTTVRTEILAGIITFLTMSYILAVNPQILGETGMDRGALFTATAVAAIAGTLFMALIANVPIAQAPGMGLNNFFAFSVVIAMGHTWQFALTGVLLSGFCFMLLTIFNIRKIIVDNIPVGLKNAIPIGIGLFITIIGLKSAGIVTPNEFTLVQLGNMADPNVWIAILGLIVIAVLLVKRVHGAILIGIIISTLFAGFLGLIQLPQGSWITLPPSIEPIFFKFEWSSIFTFDMLIVVFTFLMVNIFDAMGTLIGVISKIGKSEKDGSFPQLQKALFADALGTFVGAILGTSPNTSYVESASGVAAGGRTGLTSVSTTLMFVLALFFAPIFLMVPAAATAPALIIIGLFMMSSVADIDFNEISEGFPAFVTIIFMPFTYSIANGIIFGMLAFTIVKLLSGKVKDVSLTMYVLTLFFLIKIFLDASNAFVH
ncbi:MAG: NCS2 family permease [Bacteroidales bacterium]|jgi:AGZA family xanthine/uracil permease-like MFS transporter|nr:NCS2 family permease [Bacteroidales bacterium]